MIFLRCPGSWLAVIVDVIPIVLGVSLLMKLRPNFRGTTFSNVGLAYFFGIGAALAIGGALAGILVPQLTATMISLAPQGDSLIGSMGCSLSSERLAHFLLFGLSSPAIARGSARMT